MSVSFEEILGKSIVALITALLIWLITKYYNRSRLYCALSQLYEYSSLFDGSSTVQLVVANRGRKPEESVEVQLSTEYEYHLLAATQNGVEVSKEKVLRFPVLLSKSDVSMILVAEGRPRFSKDGIRHIRSKSSKGSIGASLTEAEASSPGTALSAVLLLLFIAVFGYGFGRFVGEDIWKWGTQKSSPVTAQQFKEGCLTVLSNAEKTRGKDNNGVSEEDLKLFATRAVTVKTVATQGDQLLVEVEIENHIEGPINYSLNLLSHASDSTTDFTFRRNKHVYDIVMLGKGEKRRYSLSDYFPSERAPKRFWLDIRLEMFGYWVTIKRSYYFGSDTSKTCSSSET